MNKRKVLLIGWDAADWKVIDPLMDQGLMPNLERMVNGGVRGRMATLDPPLSPMLWTSIATGKRPYKHGDKGDDEGEYLIAGIHAHPCRHARIVVRGHPDACDHRDKRGHLHHEPPEEPAHGGKTEKRDQYPVQTAHYCKCSTCKGPAP